MCQHNTLQWSQKKYPYHEDPYQYFDDPALARFVVSQPDILVNLNKISDEELLSHGACDLMEVLLKRASKTKICILVKSQPFTYQKPFIGLLFREKPELLLRSS